MISILSLFPSYVILFCLSFKPRSVQFVILHSISVVTVNCYNRGEFKLMNSSSIVYPYPSTPINRLFLASIYLFFPFLIKSWCCKFLELSLTTTIMVLKPVSCDNVTSFNYDGKKARDVGLIC